MPCTLQPDTFDFVGMVDVLVDVPGMALIIVAGDGLVVGRMIGMDVGRIFISSLPNTAIVERALFRVVEDSIVLVRLGVSTAFSTKGAGAANGNVVSRANA